MTLERNKLRNAVMLGLVITCTMTGNALAQEAKKDTKDAKDAKTLDTMVVTGTRIKSQSMTASSPVAEIDSESFKQTGATRADDLVNQFPQMSPYFDNFANNGAQGYPTVDLRGLGPGRTLTLVNGQRLPPGASITRDISIVPAALIKRVDLLTGGASAVYGSDAIAGVVNFVLDTDFEGISLSAGMSAYQHNNSNQYIRSKLDAKGFSYPSGNSGLDGKSKNVDIAIGGSFADGAGHAMAWLTWRENDPLMQGARDYSSCALNAGGTSCGGSGTAPIPNFYIYDDDYTLAATGGAAHFNPSTGKWLPDVGQLYNYAPINYYQRPDTRYNFGSAVRYEVNEHFRPYAEMMYINKKSRTQIAESGTFFAQTLSIDCSNPLINTMCSDLGLSTAAPLEIYVGKRNVEGGPRTFDDDTSSWRMIGGAEGSITDRWSYNLSYAVSQTENSNISRNDFLSDRVEQALMGCPAGSFAGCIPYNVWVPNGVTSAAANALQGIGLTKTTTSMTVLNGYVTGDIGWGFASANHDPIKLVAGYEWRKEKYEFTPDSNSAAGNFTGSGGPANPLTGSISVREFFMESAVPLIANHGPLKSLNLDLGYRLSDYNTSGRANTYKIGANADFGMVRLRGGYNRAIRSPNIGELFSLQSISLFEGDDPCAGTSPTYTAAQCAKMGVSAAQYGGIPASPAGQYNQFSGGNPTLKPEQAKTWTIGAAFSPIDKLDMSVDLYDIRMTDRIASIGASTILNLCGSTGDANICGMVHRRPGSGDLWIGSSPTTSGYVNNLSGNFGKSHHRGLDLTAAYRWNMFGGNANATFIGSRVLKEEIDNLPQVNGTKYDCTGKINTSCQSPKWRHIANLGFSRDWYSLNLRWRYTGSMRYVDAITGANLTTDTLLAKNGNRLSAYNMFDLSGTFTIGFVDWTVGVNNIADKEPPMVGNTMQLNGNAPGGYDQAGRYFFTSVSMKF
ncbi:MAG: TonB-dependent receptor [Xanthomonadaceae bacterium]|nr:TonB-dependent receptor [Xanthomonadaceae bacterium]